MYAVGTSESQLADFKSSLHSKLSEPPKSLSEAAARPWKHIRDRTYNFDMRQKKLAVLPTVQLSDLLDFYDQYIVPLSREAEGSTSGTSCSLSCHVAGCKASVAQDMAGKDGDVAAARSGPHTAEECQAVITVTDDTLHSIKLRFSAF